MTRRPLLIALGLVLLGGVLGGCVSAVVGGAAATGVAVAQERSVGAAIDDATIKVYINGRLFDHSEVLFSGVAVDAVEGRVLLTGDVPTAEDRIEATRIAWLAPGVTEVLNEIEVADRGGVIAYFKDVRISNQLRLALLRDGDILSINYSIETNNAVIYVMGIAQDQNELDRVLNHARNIAGVERVVNYALLKDDPRRR